MGVGQPGLNQPIARGRTADVYAWKRDQVIKLFHSWVTKRSIEQEAKISRLVHAAGLPVPWVGEVVEIAGRQGLVFERIDGISLLRMIQARPWRLISAARLLAKLHAAIHSRSVPDLPCQQDQLEAKIQAADPLPSGVKEAALRALHRLPPGDQLCHGDFHPDNLLVSSKGTVIIDWNDAVRGNPLADVARSSLLIQLASIPPSGVLARGMLMLTRGSFLAFYLRRYLQLRQVDERELQAWTPVVAAARLNEGIAEEEERLVAIAREGLQ